uniref:Phenylalanine--tRNA ligase alpha subunit n=1 Tax=Sinocyclocheilus anshuiensis TaxID=1608454 RepID=A0A671K2S9_9TELE
MADTGLLEALLRLLEKVNGGIESQDVAADLGVDHQLIVGAVKSLQALGEVISAEQKSSKRWELTGEGCEIAEQGSHEARVFNAIPDKGLPQNELMKMPSGKVGFSKAMSNKWIRLDKAHEGGPRVFKTVETIEDTVRDKLQLVQKGLSAKLEDKEKNELKKRKLLSEVTVKSYWITKGSSFSTTITKQETELTPEMIASGSWKEKKFKPYNFEAMGVAPDCGHLHPLMKVRTQFRQIFLEMGLVYVRDNFIESSFWNFDSLFQPQQHPARDQHDTFFISGEEYPPLCFHSFCRSLDNIHSKHIFQIIFCLKKWVEVGNSGVFRPEMLLPMGLPKGVSVIAWGLSLERPTMIKYGINNIRELVGHKVNLQMVYDSPICRLDS